MTTPADKRVLLADLRARLRSLPSKPEPVESAGDIGPLARLIGPVWHPGVTIEFCGSEPATLTVAAWLAGRRPGPTLLIDLPGEPCPDAFEKLGLDSQRLVVIQPPDRRLVMWAAEQALRCRSVSTTLCRIGPRLSPVTARRLALAAEAGGGLGLLIRPATREPPFAAARLAVRPVASEGKDTLRPRWEIETLYLRNGREGEKYIIEVTTDARLVFAPSELVRSTGRTRRISG